MAATYRAQISLGNTTGSTDRTATLTSAVGDLYLVFCSVSNNANDAPTCSDNRSGTYDLIAVNNYQSTLPQNYRMALFVRKQLTTGALSTQVTVATGTNDSGVVGIIAVSGMTRVGAAAVRQITTLSAQTAGTPTLAFTTTPLTGNMTLSAYANSSNPATIAGPPTGQTERFDDGAGTPPCGLQVSTRDSGTSTLTWSSSPTQYALMLLELDNSAPGTTLTVTPGAYTIAGTSTPLLLNRRITATAGAYAITGTSTPLLVGRRITATAGAYAITGTPATLIRARTLTAQAGSYAVTGTSAALQRGRPLVATAGAYAITGTPATLLLGRRLGASGGAYSVAGTAATLTYTPAGAAFVLTAQAGAYAISGTAATLTYTPAAVALTLTALPGSYAIAGTPAALRRGRTMQVTPGTYAIAGASVALRRAVRVVATAGVYTIVGTPATFLTVPLGQDFDEVLWSHFAMRQPWSGALVMRQPAAGGTATMRQPRAGTPTMRQPSAGNVALLEED